MCDTTIICTGQHDSGGTGLDEVVGGALVATGKGIYGLASLGAEVLIWAGRWFSGKPLVRPETWGRPYRFTRPVRAVARTLLTLVALAGWLQPVVTGITLAIVAGLATWLVLRRRRQAAAVPLAAVLGAPARPAVESSAMRPALTAQVVDAEVVPDVRPAITMGVAARRVGSLLGGRR